MASLIDKLRAARPIARPERPKAEACLVRQQRLPCGDFPARVLDPDALRILTGAAFSSELQPEEILFLDTETTGLQGGAGTLAFLVGLGGFQGDDFVVTQYLMRDYDEETFVLRPAMERLQSARALVTFNGSSFDMPLLQSRFTMNRLRLSADVPPHIDLVHIARRVYKMRLSSCTLQNLEAEIFGMPRQDDLPGSQVPERYFRFLKSGDLALLDDILAHNAQDILSMARLLYALAQLHQEPLSAEDQRDLYSLGHVFEKRGDRERAKTCYRACSDAAIQDLAQLRLADLMRRGGEHQEAAQAYERLRLAGRGGARVYIALAKLYEHRFAQPGRALAIARQGMVYCVDRHGKQAAEGPDYTDLAHRAGRLLQKTKGRQDGNP
ncbi:MAG: ribonuclease H-like domain-containing protein [Christensenellales bacterium]